MSPRVFAAQRESSPERRRAGSKSRDGRIPAPRHCPLDNLGNKAVERALSSREGRAIVALSGLYGKMAAKGLSVSNSNDLLEREADRWAAEALGGAAKAGVSAEERSLGVRSLGQMGSGSPLGDSLLREFRPYFGRGVEDVRLHRGPEASQAAGLLGAQAFAYGRDIFLSERASPLNRGLLAHELSHVFQGADEILLRRATWLERRAWLAFFDHYLPRKFLNNYMDDTGNPITLTRQEMQDCNPIVDLRRSRGFMAQVARLQGAGGGTAAISVTGWGGALTNGTLGNFTIHYDGTLAVAAGGSWTFSGTMWFEDYWDFNTGGANRPVAAEVKVRVANALLPGRPFAIDSVRVPVSQSQGDSRATWAAAAPTHVPDRMGRTGADIEVGAAGGVAAGPETEVGGGEVGAQSSEDLNP